MFHRVIVHYTLWFTEVEHQFGVPKALEIMKVAKKNSYNIQMNRFAKVMGFEMKDGIPKPLLDMPKEALINLINNIGVNWLANDGVWFQAVENTRDMYDAKRCNDSCWTRFAPFEAWSIKQFLGLPEQAGIEGLKKALRFSMYARINVQSIVDEGPNTIVFQMNDCRVQSARKRQGLEDYPANRPVWWNTGISEKPSTAGFAVNASAVRPTRTGGMVLRLAVHHFLNAPSFNGIVNGMLHPINRYDEPLHHQMFTM